MEVLGVSIFISLGLAGLFLACFFFQVIKGADTSADQDALLPLDDD